MSSGHCACITHYYLSAGACSVCDYTCLNCTGSSTACTKCVVGSHRTLMAGGCPCNGGYADAGVSICQTCSVTLVGCTNCSSVSVCNICDTANHFTLTGANVCDCANGYYLTLGVCVHCDISCQTCQITSTYCTSCQLNRGITTMNTCPCSNGFIDTGVAACTACSSLMPGCLDCSTTSTCNTCDTVGNFVLAGGLCHCQPSLY